MRRLSLWVLLMVFSALLMAEESLVAPPYPGAAPVDPARIQTGRLEFGGSPEERAYFLVRDERDAVLTFYRRQGIELGEPRRSQVDGLVADLYFAQVLAQSETVPRLQDYTLARSAGVQLLVPGPRDQGVYFGALKDSVDKGHHSQQEYDAVAARYAYLESCVFPPVQNDSGDWQPADQVLLERYYAGTQQGFAAAAVDMDDIAAKMQALMAEGKMEEAMALSEQMAASLDNMEDISLADSWDQGIELLEELEKLAYRALLVIDRQPEHWRTP